MSVEYNFDGLVGPSHNFGAAVIGNIASAQHAGQPSHPRQAAFEGLAKMRALHQLGVPQAVLPPHARPDLNFARRLGFEGDDTAILEALARDAPSVLAACYAASSMWVANAATVSPSRDSDDGKVHFTPANLQHMAHRSIEAAVNEALLRGVFRGPSFVHHRPLFASASLGDEGAANHMRLAPGHGHKGLHVFVYGISMLNPDIRPHRFPARQTLEASASIARLHRLPAEQLVFAQQHPAAIDAGVFHHDVIGISDRNLFICHEDAFVNTAAVLEEIQSKYTRVTGEELEVIVVPRAEISLDRAVATYLFNSQLVECCDGRRAWILPAECRDDERVSRYVQHLVDTCSGLDFTLYCPLRESMRGGGGPACLRLRVVLDDEEVAAMASGVRFDDALDETLSAWVERNYRDRLDLHDLADPAFYLECQTALDELTSILDLGPIYPFQRSKA